MLARASVAAEDQRKTPWFVAATDLLFALTGASMTAGGGAWDNAKKLIEDGAAELVVGSRYVDGGSAHGLADKRRVGFSVAGIRRANLLRQTREALHVVRLLNPA